MSRATPAIRSALAQAAAVVDMTTPAGVRAARNLARLLAQADASLGARLHAEIARTGSADARFTGASMVAYQAQVRVTVRYVEARLAGLTHEAAMSAVEAAVKHTGVTLARLETAFTGISHTPISIAAASMMDPTRGLGASLLRSNQTSAARYGQAMTQTIEQHMRLGFVSGLSQAQMVDLLTGDGGPTGDVSMRARVVGGQVEVTSSEFIPEGLFVRHRYWAERIVRTETSNAYNGAKVEALRAVRGDFPDIQKKILAYFDNRTAIDSVYVHGQVRDLDAMFVDGAAREYLHPPARPNDRETVIPWREGWSEESDTRGLSAEGISREVARIKARPRPARRVQARVRG